MSECPKCGLWAEHDDDSLECHQQRQQNARNLGEGPACTWCGERPQLGFLVHKNGCPGEGAPVYATRARGRASR